MATAQGVRRIAKRVSRSKAPVCAEGEQCFWSNDGRILSTLSDLAGALKEMRSETYAHHVTKDRNDFANWVEFVLMDKKLAASLRKAKGQKSAIVLILKAVT